MPARRRSARSQPREAASANRLEPITSDTPAQPTATPAKRKIKDSDLRGLKDLRSVAKLLERLHDVGTARDKANNRTLQMDHYCLLVLMWLYNPIIDSLRGLQQASTLQKVAQRLGVSRASLGSLSESVRVFDPERLAEIAEELSHQIPDRTPAKFAAIQKKITAVDGSVFRVLKQIAALAWLPKGNSKQASGKAHCGYRLHTQFEVFRSTPSQLTLTPAKPKGDADERVVLEQNVSGDRCYLMDRGYEKHALWNAIHAAGSNYVVRVRDRFTCRIVSTNVLTEEDRAAHVIADHVVRVGSDDTAPNHPTRLIVVKIAPHSSRGHKAERGPDSDGYLRIVTNLLDVPAELIAALYLLRWTIELYFRIIKQLLGCRHLLSTKPEGVEIQLYMALIACIMILCLTGKLPTKRTYEMICFYLQGWASLAELEAHLEKLATRVP